MVAAEKGSAGGSHRVRCARAGAFVISSAGSRYWMKISSSFEEESPKGDG